VGVALGQFVLEWILVGLIVVQFGLGFKVRTEMTDPEVSVDLFWLKRIHKYLGTFMSLLGKVIVILMLEPTSEL
jgi:cytochrome b561